MAGRPSNALVHCADKSAPVAHSSSLRSDLATRLQLDAEQLSMPLLHTGTAEQVGYAHVKVRDRAVDGCGLQACRKLGSETFRYLFSDLRHLGLQTINT